MGFILSGLHDEPFDRNYSDFALVKRFIDLCQPEYGNVLRLFASILIGALSNAMLPIYVAYSIDEMQTATYQIEIARIIMGIIILGLLIWFSNAVRRYLSATIQADILHRLREQTINSILGQELTFYQQTQSGQLVSRLVSDTEVVSRTLNLVSEFINHFCLIIFLGIYLFTVSGQHALVVVVIMPIILVIALSFRKYARVISKKARGITAQLNGELQESLRGLGTVKSFGKEQLLIDKFVAGNDNYYKVHLHQGLTYNMILPLLNLVAGLFTVLILYISGRSVQTNQLSLGEWYLFVQGISLIWYPLTSIASFWSQFQQGLAAAERVYSLLDAEPDVIQTGDNFRPNSIKGNISLLNLSFQYTKETEVFENLSLDILAGQSVALVGHSGSGKSSLVSLLARFFEYHEGIITIDGYDIRSLDLSYYRKHLGFINQNPILYVGTVAENIRYGRNTLTNDDILHLVNEIGGGEWLKAFPDGLNTIVSERGNNLSSGQRQLIMMTRILAQEPPIVIFDEATANIDPITESLLTEGLKRILNNRTTIIIAHKLSTIKNADRILVFDNCRIVQDGTHNDLLKSNGQYRELYNSYFSHQSFHYFDEIQ